MLAIRDAGTEVPTLIIGTIPLWIMLLGRPAGLRWSALGPGLVLTAAGLALMMGESRGLVVTQASPHPDYLRGIGYAVAAMVSWTAFGLLNAAWLHRHPEVPAEFRSQVDVDARQQLRLRVAVGDAVVIGPDADTHHPGLPDAIKPPCRTVCRRCLHRQYHGGGEHHDQPENAHRDLLKGI